MPNVLLTLIKLNDPNISIKLFETKKNEIVFELFLHILIIIAKYHCIFKVFVLMQFDPGMEYRPDYRAPGFGMGNKAGGIGSGIPHGLLPQGGGGGGNLMGQHMAGMNQRPGHAMPGILPPPSQQVRSLIFVHYSSTVSDFPQDQFCNRVRNYLVSQIK